MSGLDEMIATLQRLEKAPREVARIAAPLVEAAAKATARAGTTPTGEKWQAKKDGGPPLVNAAAALSTKALGETIVTTLEGVEVVHNYGTGNLPKRQILPDGGAGIPDPIAAAVQRAAGEYFDRAMGGG